MLDQLIERCINLEDVDGFEFRSRVSKILKRLEYFQRTQFADNEMESIRAEISRLEIWNKQLT